MKRLSYIISGVVAVALQTAFVACGDDDYSAGPEVASDSPNAYFSSDNDSLHVIDLGDNGPGEISLKVVREKTQGATTIPIIVDKNNANFSIPESVTFEDGDSVKNVTVSYEAYKVGMSFTVHLAEQYANPYKQKDGDYSFSVTVTQPYEYCSVEYERDTTYTSTGTVVSGRFHGVTDSKIYAYAGINQFLWTDFFGSGVNLKFTIDTSNSTGKFDASDLTLLNGDIVPLDHYTSDGYGYSLVSETGGTDYVTWTPAGSSEETTLYFYGYYSGHYSFIDFEPGSVSKKGYGYLWSCYDAGGYENIYFYLNYTNN